MKEFVRRARSHTQAAALSEPVLPIQNTPVSPRMSILPSVRIPLLRRQENEDPPSNKKPPLLTLKLSSRSFLDSTITSDTSEEPLYKIKTSGTSTSISRTDPKHVFVKAASVKWPRVLPVTATGKESTDVVLIQVQGSRWTGGDVLLRPPTALHGPRKFNIPGYSQPLRWKRYGTVYWCTTSSVKGPIAVLETARESEPTKLIFYATLHDKYDPDALSAFQGVSVLLLDYVLVTALFLVTDVQDWMLVPKYQGTSPQLPFLPSHTPGSSSVDRPLTSDPQLRKIMYGEPIYPKMSRPDLRLRESRSKHSSSSTSPTTIGPPQTPTSMSSGRPLSTYQESESSSHRAPSPKHTLSSIITSDNDYDDSFSMSDARSVSPLPESVHFSTAAPSHVHADPLFYGSSERPPVPPLPSQYRSHSSRIFVSQPTPPKSTITRAFRELPASPAIENASRTGISPPEDPSNLDSVIQHALQTPRAGRPASIRSFSSSMSHSAIRRPLPRPPPVPPIGAVPTLTVRRAQSSSQLRAESSRSQLKPTPTTALAPARPQRSLPPTPIIVQATSGSSTGSSTPLTPTAQHSRQPPITKASQEDLTKWVHMLTNPQRDLPPAPLPSTSIYDVPPPAYETINFSNSEPNRRPSTRG